MAAGPSKEEAIEKQTITDEDAKKAKKKGGLFGDPVLVIE
jgi:hypothetical protein